MSQAKILVVDDEPDILEMLSRSLRDEEYRVLVADNGEGALAKVRQERPEVVLLDIRMPGKYCRQKPQDVRGLQKDRKSSG